MTGSGFDGVIEADANPKDLVGQNKVPLFSVVPPSSLIAEGIVMRHGAEKYGPYNWREKSVQISIYIDAAMRHISAYWDGEDIDKDSGISHLFHAKAGLGVLIDAIESGKVIDNRPSSGPASRMLEEPDGQQKVRRENGQRVFRVRPEDSQADGHVEAKSGGSVPDSGWVADAVQLSLFN